MKKEIKKYSLDFGKKEKVLNYTCQTYQLSRPNKVGSVMALIRECQPQSIEEWESWYFENAKTDGKEPDKITREKLEELGKRLHLKIVQCVIPEWEMAFRELTLDDCINYIHNLTINRTYDGYVREKSVIHDGLAKLFPDVRFEESSPYQDHACDIDYLGWVNDERAFGIQIKPMTAKANFGNYSISDRMKSSFDAFSTDFGGAVFLVFSLDGELGNKAVVEEIRAEVERLGSMPKA